MKSLKFTSFILASLLAPISPSHARDLLDPTTQTRSAISSVVADPLTEAGPESRTNSPDQTLQTICSLPQQSRFHGYNSSVPGSSCPEIVVELPADDAFRTELMNQMPAALSQYASIECVIVLIGQSQSEPPSNLRLRTETGPEGSSMRQSSPMLRSDGGREVAPRFIIAAIERNGIIVDFCALPIYPALDLFGALGTYDHGGLCFDQPITGPDANYRQAPLTCVDNSPASVTHAVATVQVPALAQNYPNPFNPTTEIAFDLSAASHIVLAVFDLAGQRIRTLINDTQPAGRHRAVWNGTDESGADVAPGIYLYRLETGNSVNTKKMVLLR